jgi:hypothetical protein
MLPHSCIRSHVRGAWLRVASDYALCSSVSCAISPSHAATAVAGTACMLKRMPGYELVLVSSKQVHRATHHHLLHDVLVDVRVEGLPRPPSHGWCETCDEHTRVISKRQELTPHSRTCLHVESPNKIATNRMQRCMQQMQCCMWPVRVVDKFTLALFPLRQCVDIGQPAAASVEATMHSLTNAVVDGAGGANQGGEHHGSNTRRHFSVIMNMRPYYHHRKGLKLEFVHD